VSRLLALTHVVSSVRDNVAYPVSSKQILSANYWAAYFHQASIGAHHNLQLLSANTLKRKAQSPCKVKVCYLSYCFHLGPCASSSNSRYHFLCHCQPLVHGVVLVNSCGTLLRPVSAVHNLIDL